MVFKATERERIDKFLSKQLPDWSRSKIQEQMELGNVLVDSQSVKTSFKVQPGMEVTLNLQTTPHSMDLTPIQINLDIVYEDEYLLVVNKPRGLATHPAPSLKEPTLVHALLAYADKLSTGTASFRPGIVHRLDKETSGLLMIAKTDPVHAQLSKQIQEKQAQRIYLALVLGSPMYQQFTVDAAIGRDPKNRLKMAITNSGKSARTDFKVLKVENHLSLIEAKLQTGRTHQIRVHLNSIGHPVIGDPLYGKKPYNELPMKLHAAELKFTHPITQQVIELKAPLPEDFQ